MKLKYYMRGLGIGIVLATLIFTISGTKEKLSDQEIVKRAEALGMEKKEDNSELDEVLNQLDNAKTTPPPASVTPVLTNQPSVEPTKQVTPALTVMPVPTGQPTPEPNATPEPTVTLKPELTNQPTAKPTRIPSDGDKNSEKISFTITKGMNSQTVADLLQEKGLIEEADDFNDYIVKVGKASIIRVGKFTIRQGADYDEIVKAITSK